MALNRRIYLDAELVTARAQEFPVVRELLGDRVADVLNGKQKRFDAAPLLLRLLEQTGPSSQAMLRLFSEGITYFDLSSPPGWQEWRGTLAGLERVAALARYFELLTAMFFAASDYQILAFEPPGAPGRRADLLVAVDGDELLVEATGPGPHQSDWVDDAMDHLTLALSRVESGLTIAVDGYESLAFDSAAEWGAMNPIVGTQQREDLVAEFARQAARLDPQELPQVVISPSPDQPIRITVVDHHEELHAETVVRAGWSRSGLVPNVKRLAEKILAERQHLPDSPPSAILVDLSRWQDFRHADYYLNQVALELAGRTRPAVFVGSCVGTFVDPSHQLIERGVIASDSDWESGTLGQRLRSDWGGTDHT